MLSVWWVWVCTGILILLAEAVTPGGFYLFFIGIAAIISGALVPAINSTWISLLLFAVLSAVLIVTLRKPLSDRVKKDTPQADTPEFIGETARAIVMIPVGKEGSIELRGTTWKARNVGTIDVPENGSCIIIDREGLLLTVSSKT